MRSTATANPPFSWRPQTEHRNGVGFPRILPTPAGCAPSRVLKVKGNWTPTSSSSGSAFEASSSGRAQRRRASARRVPTTPQPPGPRGVLRLAGPGQAGRGRLTRSPGRSAGWAEAFAAPLLHECAPGSNRVGARRGHRTPDRGAVTCKSRQLLPPSIPPRGLADGASRPRPALPRPFRQRRRGESGPGGAHGSGGGGAATPAGGRSSADCAENRPGRVEPRRQRRVFIFTWPEKRAYLNVVSLDFLRSQTPLNIFESYNVVSRKMSLACRASIQMEAHSKCLSI